VTKPIAAHSTSREFEDLARYLKAVRGQTPLTREAEHELALRVRDGDETAKQELVRHNLSFVVAIARKQRRGSVRLDDLIQEGNVGLMRAAEKFNPDAGTRFSTYAVWWIRAYIGKYPKEARSSVRPQSGTVAQADLSLDSTIDEEGDLTHLERIEDDHPGPEDRYIHEEGDAEVRVALTKVPSESASSAGTSSTTGSSRTRRRRWRRSASAGASRASGYARSRSRPSSSCTAICRSWSPT